MYISRIMIIVYMLCAFSLSSVTTTFPSTECQTCPPIPICTPRPTSQSFSSESIEPPKLKTTPTTKSNPGCSGTGIIEVTNNGNKFGTKDYSGTNYEDNQEYCWRFKATKQHEKLSISFLSMQTEYGYDTITVLEDNAIEKKDEILLIASGNISPENVISQTNEIRVIFKTDVSKNMKGFEALIIAVKKKDLPQFSWEHFLDGKIGIIFFPNSLDSIQETIQVQLIPNYEKACVFHGSTEKSNLTVASAFYGRNCQSLGQHIQLSLSSMYLGQTKQGQAKRASFALKNGILQETTEEPFVDNVLVNSPAIHRGLQQSPSHIEIRTTLAYDRSILEKFKHFGAGDLEIKKQLRQLFFFAKTHLEELSGKTKIELILKEDIMFINEIFKVNQSHLNYIRKFQTKNTEPLIVLCGDFDEQELDDVFHTGLAYRSGACRKDEERYGVGLVAWRENLAVVGDALAHEIEHLFGMTHHGHTHHDITKWFSKQGRRCYTETCPSPPRRENGDWICTENNKMCHLKCSIGFDTAIAIIHCENGHFSYHLEKAACSPSVFLLTGPPGGYVGGRHIYIDHMEVYHPTNATIKDVKCSNLPPMLQHNWVFHASIFHDGVLILCGGPFTSYICSSINMVADDPQWLIHKIPYTYVASVVISSNTLYLFDTFHSNLKMSTLPLEEAPQFTQDNKFEYNAQGYCVVQLDGENVALLGGYDDYHTLSNATVYNVKQQTSIDLPAMNEPRSAAACIKVNINGTNWLVVSGGSGEYSYEYKKITTERLNLDEGKNWEPMDNLYMERLAHQMIWTDKDTIAVLGGYDSENDFHLDSIEHLHWESKSWHRLEQSLVKPRSAFGAVELPASLLGCQMNDPQECLNLPHIDYGTWKCDTGRTKCGINCDPGYVSTLTHTTCRGGVWSKVDRIQCQPSVWLEFSSHMFYHPSIGHPTCSKPLPAIQDYWDDHTTFVYNKYLYNCGGHHTGAICISLNLDDDEFQWKRHRMDISRNSLSRVILENKLFIIDPDNGLMSTILPLDDTVTFIEEPNQTIFTSECTIKLNEYSFVTISDFGEVTKYNVKDQTETQLSMMDRPPGKGVGCIIVNMEGTPWLVVSGGNSDGLILQPVGRKKRSKRNPLGFFETGRLDLSSNIATWEELGYLNTPRYSHSMINSVMGIVAVGGVDVNTVEVLNWKTKEWSYVEPSLSSVAFAWRNELVEVPSSSFGCQTIPIDITDCKGEYDYNQEYPGGDEKEVPNGETCQSVCEKEAGCEAWTWNADDQQCRVHETMGTLKNKSGSVSGFKMSCKPKCYLILENQNETISTRFCNNTAGSNHGTQRGKTPPPDLMEETMRHSGPVGGGDEAHGLTGGGNTPVGPMGVGKCCMKKEVGGNIYNLKRKADRDLSEYQCWNECIYKMVDDPEPQSEYCFKNGGLSSMCLSSDPNYSKDPTYTKDPNYSKVPTYTKDPNYPKDPTYTKDPNYSKVPTYTKDPNNSKDPTYTKDPNYSKDPTYTKDPNFSKDPNFTKDPIDGESGLECNPMLQMVPDEFPENSKILICYVIEGKRLCEEIKYEDVGRLCNAEPIVVTLTTFKHINKHHYYGHLKPYFGYNG